MGKRTVTTEVERLEEEELYFCDDCGNPHDLADLSNYRNGTDVLYFCADCERRFEETQAAVAGYDTTDDDDAEWNWLWNVPWVADRLNVETWEVHVGLILGFSVMLAEVSIPLAIFGMGVAAYYGIMRRSASNIDEK